MSNSYQYKDGIISVYPIHFDWNGKTGKDATCVAGCGASLIAADKQVLVKWALNIQEKELEYQKERLKEVYADMKQIEDNINYLKAQKI